MELDVDYLPHNEHNSVLGGTAIGDALTFGFTPKGFTIGSGIRLHAAGETFANALAQLADTGSIRFPPK